MKSCLKLLILSLFCINSVFAAKYETIVHKGLELERQYGFIDDAKLEESCVVMDSIIDGVKAEAEKEHINIPEISTKDEAIRFLALINSEIRSHGIHMGRDVMLLSEALTDTIANCNKGSMIYIAVGQALGFPLKMVAIPSHLFIRAESKNFLVDWETNSEIASVIGAFETVYFSVVTGEEELHHHFGDALFRMGRYEEAIEHYREVLWLNPDYAEARFSLGVALLKTGKNEEAHCHLGDALYKMGRFEHAIPQYKEALKLNSNDVDVHNNLGKVLLLTGRNEEAIDQYREVLRFKSDDADVHNNLGVALFKTGEYEKAIVHYKKTLALKPDCAEAKKNIRLALESIKNADL